MAQCGLCPACGVVLKCLFSVTFLALAAPQISAVISVAVSLQSWGNSVTNIILHLFYIGLVLYSISIK